MTRRPNIRAGQGLVEVGDRCWAARYDLFDVNVGVVAGARGVVVVDTTATEADARQVLGDVRRLGAGEVVAVVNTHAHFDHTFGNATVHETFPGAVTHGHETMAADLPQHAEWAKREAATDDTEARHAEVAAARVRGPDRTFSSARVIDLGDRAVEVLYPGRGHTGGDAVVVAADAGVVYAGDLVEQSEAHGGAPGYGEDCFPMDWPASLDLVVGLLRADSVVVPGHGDPVDREFVFDQRTSVGQVAQTISELAGSGVPADQALSRGEWPYPTETLTHAVTRGYAHLPRSGKQLPLA